MVVPNSHFDVSRAAILSMDLQNSIVSIYAREHPEFLPRVANVQEMARRRGMRVIHVQVGFRTGLPEVSEDNQLFGAIRKSPQWQKLFEGEAGAIHGDVAPREAEVVIIKHRVSAFRGTDLEMILRANEIKTLILFGIATSGVVLSTLLEASDADYLIYVVEDCCIDQDEELHACLMNKLFPKRATVIKSEELIGMLGEGGS
jgi:nicotinamidase-related amidase